jgi:hypothetical protein
MEENDYIKLSLLNVNGQDAVEIDVFASKDTLTNMIYGAMCNNNFFANSVTSASRKYFLYLDEYDYRARLN